MSVLEEIIVGVREDLQSRKTTRAELDDRIAAIPPALNPIPSLRSQEDGGIHVIAEVKRSSPSKGSLATISDPAALAKTYQGAGASVVSVLTEGRRFGGSLSDLSVVRESVTIPVLRKDFMVDEYQFYEARAYGADLVLLIVAALSQSELQEFMELTSALGMHALVEVHTPEELERALQISPEIIGVNSRNLKTLEVDPAVFTQLIPLIPEKVTRVAESGIASRDDVVFAQKQGADAVLVGEALVRGSNPGAALRALLGRG
ncbi:MAG: indole-3-glycerol phosphate synthase TrpC [Candidatus Nanopelagicaceae bacterium]|nr:indole-3-glycerol phosphate synthase TrpC [Candidatus Nanopelagicaceae bacterium]